MRILCCRSEEGCFFSLNGEPSAEYGADCMFCLVPFTKSDMVFLCLRTNVSVQTDLSLCRATCHNHATKGKNTIHIVSREGEHKLEKWKKLS